MRSRKIATLQEFSQLMSLTRKVRARLTQGLLGGEPPGGAAVQGGVEQLARARELLEAIPMDRAAPGKAEQHGRRRLRFRGDPLALDLSYELEELAKDLVYLRDGEQALLDYLAALQPELPGELAEGRRFFASAPERFQCFVTDRDGTVNNYCGRYTSSVQSVYNAVFLSRFARRRSRRSVILSSAPLAGGGLAEVSVFPPGRFVLAGSKGREALDEDGRLHRLEVPAAQAKRLEALNRALTALVGRPEFEVFGLIGSGLQLKFGQSTVAYQDVHASVPEVLSRRFHRAVHDLVHDQDPAGETFRVEDTGKDLEILLTVADGGGALRDFHKGDGVRFLDRELGLGLARGPVLVCGDTASDLPMVEAAVRAAGAGSRGGAGSDDLGGTPRDHPWCVFVTQETDLRAAAEAACPRAWFAGRPDVLVALLNELAKEER